ncbi:MAG: DUF3429 domain-containing protein [Rhodocyclaceae bacterium]|nr:DUF3429 domain-containing protein [Rhodocyclaceae bacterium]
MYEPKRIATILSYAGTIPFVVCAVILLFGTAMGLGSLRQFAGQAITSYAAVIVSFLGGIQWGVALATHEQQPQTARSLFLLSVVPSLLAWATLFLPNGSSRVIVAIFLIGFVWVIDALLHLQQVLPTWFFHLRSIVSAVAMTSLIAALLVG